MNKKIIEYCNANGLEYDNQLIYGRYNGYQVSVNFGGATSSIAVVSFAVNLGDKVNEFLTYLETNKKQLKILQSAMTGGGVACTFTPFTIKSALVTADKILQEITLKLRELGILENTCPYCNKDMESPVLVSDAYSKFYAHEECFNEKYDAIKQQEDAENAKPNNYLFGFFGALIGAIVGGIAFAIVYYLGYLASICSMIGALLGGYLYSKFGGKNNAMKVVIVSITTIVVTILSFFLTYIILIQIEITASGVSESALVLLMNMLQTMPEFAELFWADFGSCMFFCILGLVFIVIPMINSLKKASSTMKKH